VSTITRGVKAAGGTNFTSGTPILASEVNTDLNTIYNDHNGGLTDANVNAGANIDPSKIGDYSATAAEQATDATPGVAGAESLATTLEGEIARLRYTIGRLAGYVNAEHEAGAGLVSVPWIEPPSIGENLIRNASFATVVNTYPVPFEAVGALISTQVDAEEALGWGLKWNTVAAGLGDGIRYTFEDLRASTKYLLVIRASIAAGGATISTSGADGTSQYRNFSKAIVGGTQTIYAFVFQTDGTPTDVVLEILGGAAGYTCSFTHFGCYELSSDPVRQETVHSLQVVEDAVLAMTAGQPYDTICTMSVYAPPGHVVRLLAHGQAACVAAAASKFKLMAHTGATLGYEQTLDHTTSGQDLIFVLDRIDFTPINGFNTYTLQALCTGANVNINNTTLTAEVIPLR
jgi:hypothetical protein